MAYKFNANKVAGLMGENKMTQKDFSFVIGTSENTVRNKLHGRHDFTAEEICLMSNFFKVDPAIFFEKEVAQ